MARRHANEFLRTNFVNSGRIAGMGILYDDYSEESGGPIYGGKGVVIVRYPERNEEEKDKIQNTEELMQKGEIETIAEMIRKLKADGITLEEVAEELNYRDNANVSKWDDNLFEYNTEELELIEQFWDAVVV